MLFRISPLYTPTHTVERLIGLQIYAEVGVNTIAEF